MVAQAGAKDTDAAFYTAARSGNSYDITLEDISNSLLTESHSIEYHGQWWSDEVGTNTQVAEGFCSSAAYMYGVRARLGSMRSCFYPLYSFQQKH